MIAFLKGFVQEIEADKVILDVSGVGYEVFASSKTLNQLTIASSKELWIYTHVREDALKLFGFSDPLEKKLFLAFIGINGIGPKMALAFLSSADSLEHLVEMIEKEDLNGLTRLPRVGKKSAQQMIIALKGHLKPEGLKLNSEQIKAREDLSRALLNLGFRSGEIRSVLDQMQVGQNIEQDLKQALSYLGPGS